MAVLDQAMEQAKAVQRDLQSGQMSLFGVVPETQNKTELSHIPMPDIPEWDERKKLVLEKETVGFYITGHPLNDAIQEINTIIDCQIQDLIEWGDDQPVRIGGLIRSCKKLKSKRGDPMAFLAVEDLFEAVEVVVFPNTYAECEELLSSTDPLIIQGTVQKDDRGPKIIAESIDSLQDAREKYTEAARIKLNSDKLSRQQLEKVKKTLYQYHGSCPVRLTLHFSGRGEVDIDVLKDLTIRPCRALTDTMEEILDYKAISFSKKPLMVKPRKKRWDNKAKSHQ
jgi:DNA polymerase-3 subunit alpha